MNPRPEYPQPPDSYGADFRIVRPVIHDFSSRAGVDKWAWGATLGSVPIYEEGFDDYPADNFPLGWGGYTRAGSGNTR